MFSFTEQRHKISGILIYHHSFLSFASQGAVIIKHFWFAHMKGTEWAQKWCTGIGSVTLAVRLGGEGPAPPLSRSCWGTIPYHYSPNAPTWLGTSPTVIKIDMLLDYLLQTFLQGWFGSTSAEHQDITVTDKDDVHARSLWGSKSWLGVTMRRLPGRRRFQSKGYLACFWN